MLPAAILSLLISFTLLPHVAASDAGSLDSTPEANNSSEDSSGLLDAELEAPEDLELPSLWVPGVEVRLGSGYKDNVMLASRNAEKSVLGTAGLDLSLFRLPVGGWDWFFLSSADYIRYPDAREAKEEAAAIVQAQGKKSFAESWQAGASAEYLYFNQVFDASILEDEPAAIKLEGHAVTLRPLLSRTLPKGYEFELELPVTRQFFAEALDDYWEAGPKLVLGRDFGRVANLELSYQFAGRFHDTREARDAAGELQQGRILEFYQHETQLSWRQFWDAQRRWRTVTKLSLQANDDNGGGFYNYLRPQFSEQVRYQTRKWEAQLEARVSHYAYSHQRTDGADSPLRERTYIRLNARGERVVWKAIRLFAEYEFERAISNLELDDYSVNMFAGGVTWEF